MVAATGPEGFQLRTERNAVPCIAVEASSVARATSCVMLGGDFTM